MNSTSPLQKAAAIWSLVEIVSKSTFQLTVPSQPLLLGSDPAQLAKDAAASAVRIANASAALGVSGDDDANAQIIWAATLENIERVQKLHGLPRMAFQNKPLPRLDSGSMSSL